MRPVGGVDCLEGVDGHFVVSDVNFLRLFDDHRPGGDAGEDGVADVDEPGPGNLEAVYRNVGERHVVKSEKW